MSPNNAIASVKAKPNKAYENNFDSSLGFLTYDTSKAAKTTPIPTPLPIIDVEAIPAATNFSPISNNSIVLYICRQI